MPHFRYIALSDSGTTTSGELEADSLSAARDGLCEKGLFVVKLTRVRRLSLSRRVDDRELLLFVKELRVLLRSELAVPEALEIASRGRSARLRAVVHEVIREVRGGCTLSGALATVSASIDPLLVGMVSAGETSGDVVLALSRYQSIVERRLVIAGKLRQALIYPAFILAIVLIILLVVFEFTLPRFVAIYADLNAELPAATEILVWISAHFDWLLGTFIGLAAATWLLFSALSRHRGARQARDRLLLNFPLYGALLRAYSLAIAGRTLSSMMDHGVNLAEGLASVSRLVSNFHIREQLQRLSHSLSVGTGVAAALKESSLFPELARKMLITGDAAGRLPEQLQDMAQYYEEEAEQRLKVILALIEPVIILLTGVLVGGVVIMMYLPIFSLAGSVR